MTQICIITGAAKGIGKATLQKYLQLGYQCIGIDKDEQALTALREELDKEMQERVQFVCADLEQEVELEALTALRSQSAQHLTLVNNIGGSKPSSASFEEGTWEQFYETIAFNLKPLHTMTRLCLPIMKESQYGRIVNVSSISARLAMTKIGAEYPASKAAIIALSRHLAAEVAEDGILVNTICPGIIGTERMLKRWSERDPAINESKLAQIPLKRLGTPTEIAEAIAFLGSTTNNYITGAILDANGGMYLP